MLVLALLAQDETYGYALVTRLQEAGLDDISAGTVYPVLNRLERDGTVESRLVASPAGPARKYYRPTPAGLEELAAARAAWQHLAATVAGVLAPPPAATAPATTAPATTEES